MDEVKTTRKAAGTPLEAAHHLPTFRCPTCGSVAQQMWHSVQRPDSAWGSSTPVEDWDSAWCTLCGGVSLWREKKMVYPNATVIGPEAHADMPERARRLFNEARSVGAASRRSAAALLRLTLQVLVDDLVEGGGKIDAKIGAMVKKGLDPMIQRAMDVVRVVGNNAVHPGQIDVDDDPALVPALFDLVNMIVEQMITRPKMIDELFHALPEGAREAISRRDGTGGSSE